MRKLVLSSSVALALGLAGCGGSDETLSDIQAETEVQTPFSRIVFDPANGNLNIPNDLLMLPGDDGFFDYTLNIPVDDPTDFASLGHCACRVGALCTRDHPHRCDRTGHFVVSDHRRVAAYREGIRRVCERCCHHDPGHPGHG